MHEWALADAVIQTALNVAQREGLKRVTSIKISLGELQDIEREFFDTALNELMKTNENLFSKTKINIKTIKTKFKCRACSHQWMLDDTKKTLDEETKESIHFIPEVAHVFIRCPKCGSPDFDVTEGRGIRIDSITGEK